MLDFNFDRDENRPPRRQPGLPGEFTRPVDRVQREASTDELSAGLDRWVEQEMFEEDLRAVLKMMRPHGQERLAGWREYRTGGAHFRVTVSWDAEFAGTNPDAQLSVPHMTDVIETLLVGSANDPDEIAPEHEFNRYRQVLCEVYERLHERQSCHE